MKELAVIGIEIAAVLAAALFALWWSLKPKQVEQTSTEIVEYQKMRAEEDFALLFYIHAHNLGNQCDAMLLNQEDPLQKVYWNTVKLLFYEKTFS